ncbi:MAG: MFS transporter, partial [Pseudomonadota bacterium]
MPGISLGGGVLVIAGVVCAFVRSRPEQMGLRQVGAEESTSPVTAFPDAPKVSSLQWSHVIK